MTQQEINILHFENELAASRQKLNNLIYELHLPSDENTRKLIQTKIDLMTMELHHMENQLQLLKSCLETDMAQEHIPFAIPGKQPILRPNPNQIDSLTSPVNQPTDHSIPQTMSQTQPQPIPPATSQTQPQAIPPAVSQTLSQTVPKALSQPMPQTISKSISQPESQAIPETMSQPMPQAMPQPQIQYEAQTSLRQPKNTNLEDIFGRNLMGIFASVLIFIGMVLFGMVIVPALSDEMKILCMYLVSFLVTAVGMAFMKKSPTNKFFISLTGLGTGGLFISLIMSNVYFHLFGDLLTYILLFGWAAGTILLSKYEKSLSGTEPKIHVFEIIGQLGVMISVILGCILCAREKDSLKFLMLIIYHLIAMTAFHLGSGWLTKKEHDRTVLTRSYKVQNHIFKLLTILILILSYIMCMITPESSYAFMTIEEVFITIFLVLTITADLFVAYKEEKTADFACICYHGSMGVYALFGVMLILQFGTLYLPEVLLSYVLCIVLLLLTETQKNKQKIAAQVPLFLIALVSLISIEASAGIIYLLFGTVLLMLVGIRKKSSTYLIAGTASLYLWAFWYFIAYTITLQTVIAVILCTASYLYIRNKTEETAVRIAGYPIILLAVTIVLSTFLTNMKNHLPETSKWNEWLLGIRHFKTIIAFSIAGVFHIWMTKKDSFPNRNEKIMARIINAVLMFTGCYAISYHEISLLPILIAIGVFTLNSREILLEEELKNSTTKKKYWIMAYILLKYTILLTVILTSFQTPEFMISIALLVFAVLSIIAGFWKRKKGYRLYGLVLSMISIFKLVMLDANMKDAITGSISFIICGLLCFAISFIYNKIQKEYFDDTKK